jgi:hypothetical protein
MYWRVVSATFDVPNDPDTFTAAPAGTPAVLVAVQVVAVDWANALATGKAQSKATKAGFKEKQLLRRTDGDPAPRPGFPPLELFAHSETTTRPPRAADHTNE